MDGKQQQEDDEIVDIKRNDNKNLLTTTSGSNMMMTRWAVLAMLVSAVYGEVSTEMEKAITHELEIPDPFAQGHMEVCNDNLVVKNWCDSHLTEKPAALKCGMLQAFQEYACGCPDDPTMCPTECLEGSQQISKTRSMIRCRGFPSDTPNYILKESHPHHHNHDCGDNAMVSAWCDDYVNPHLECALFRALDQYVCRCSGKATNCPDECLHGSDALIRTSQGVVCTGIPNDTVNYEVN